MGSKSSQKWARRLRDNPALVLTWPNEAKRTAMFRRLRKTTGKWMIISSEKAIKMNVDGTWQEFDIPDGMTVADNVPGARFINPTAYLDEGAFPSEPSAE